MYADLIAHFLVQDREEMRPVRPAETPVAVVIAPAPVLAQVAAFQPAPPALTPPRPASAARTNPCPVQSWVYRRWTATSDVVTYNADKKTPVGKIWAGSVIEGCQDPSGWVATFSGWVAP